jgi:glyoxylase-like metal-dependent hydrolase (beta-lactamase superfamily II)
VVVDPIRDTDRYLRLLEERGLTLSAIVETHIHVDFASGARTLAEATGAEPALSGCDEGNLDPGIACFAAFALFSLAPVTMTVAPSA